MATKKNNKKRRTAITTNNKTTKHNDNNNSIYFTTQQEQQRPSLKPQYSARNIFFKIYIVCLTVFVLVCPLACPLSCSATFMSWTSFVSFYCPLDLENNRRVSFSFLYLVLPWSSSLFSFTGILPFLHNYFLHININHTPVTHFTRLFPTSVIFKKHFLYHHSLPDLPQSFCLLYFTRVYSL